MNNLQIREFSQSIINFVNASPLPLEVKRLALLDIQNQVENAVNEMLKKELMERDEEEKEHDSDGEVVSENRVGEYAE